MKRVSIILIIACLQLTAFSQKYTKYIVVSESSVGACDGKILMKTYNTSISSIFIFDQYREHLLSTVPYVDGLCGDIDYPLTSNDTACFYVEDDIFVYADSALQPQLDTIYITMPSSIGACDASMSIVFNHTQAYHEIILYGPTGGVTYVTPGNYTGLCDGQYHVLLYDNNLAHGVYEMDVDLRLDAQPCAPFIVTIDGTATSGMACNGAMNITASGGIDTILYRPHIYYNHADITDIYSPTPDSLCEGLYEIFVENFQMGGSITNQYTYYHCYYLGNDTPPISFGVPTSIPSSSDTINLPPVSNCDINYSLPIDTAYVDYYTFIDTSQFQVNMVLIQGVDTFNFIYLVAGDTSSSHFFNFTVFCDDPTRSSVGYYEFYVFNYSHADILASIAEPGETNSVVLYPNPAADFLYIDKTKPLSRIEIRSINGELIRVADHYKNKEGIDVSMLSPGFYTITVNEGVGVISCLKFIKAR